MFKNVKRKTDKDDAIKLARLASVDQLVKTHVPSKAVREHRGLACVLQIGSNKDNVPQLGQVASATSPSVLFEAVEKVEDST